MRKLFKNILITLVTLILLALIAIISIVILINPNEFRVAISNQILQHTGRTLAINGDIHWTVYPWLGLEINNATLSNTSEFFNQNFATVEKADVQVKLMPLLSDKLEFGNLLLKGLHLTLIKNPKGVGNWQTVTTPPSNNSSTAQQTNTKTVNTLSTINISKIDISNSQITWINQKSNQKIELNKLELHSKNISQNKPFDLSIQFSLVSNRPELNGNFKLTSKTTINPQQETYTFDNVDLAATLLNSKYDNGRLNINVASDLTLNLKDQTFSLPDLVAKINNLKMNGKFNGSKIIDNPTIQGEIKAPELKLMNLTFSNVSAKINAIKNNIKIAPLTALFYQGTYRGNIAINTNGKIAANQTLENIQAEPFFRDFTSMTKVQLSGTATVQSNLTMTGFDANTIKHSVNGTVNFNIRNSVLKGIDALYYVKMALALAKKQSLPSSNSKQTEFGIFSGTFQITNGIANTQNLSMLGPYLQMKGTGTANLISEQLNFSLDTYQPKTNELKDIPITIKVTGTFDNPNIRPNVDSLVKLLLQKALENNTGNIKDKIGDVINKNVGKNLGDQLKKNLNLDKLFK